MKNLLPNGSVVVLKDSNRKIMIHARWQGLEGETENRIFDYGACLYPEGTLDANETILFDHENIEYVLFVGYRDIDEFKYLEYIKEQVEEKNSWFSS